MIVYDQSLNLQSGLSYRGKMQQVVSQLILDLSKETDDGTAGSAPLLVHINH